MFAEEDAAAMHKDVTDAWVLLMHQDAFSVPGDANMEWLNSVQMDSLVLRGAMEDGQPDELGVP